MPKQIVIPFQGFYPFGQYSQKILPQDKILVQDTFKTSSKQIAEDVKTICTIRRAFAHPNLINIKNFYSENNVVKAYYQYVHLRAQMNFFQLDQSLQQKFKNQLFDLINSLKQATVKFQFQPENLGMGVNRETKYFLRTFEIGHMDLDEHYQNQKKKIIQFLKEATKEGDKSLNYSPNKSLKKSNKSRSPRSIRRDQKQICSSVSTSHSSQSSQYQPKTKKITESQKYIKMPYQIKENQNERKSCQLIDLVEDSKRKSLQALKMYRKIKGKQ